MGHCEHWLEDLLKYGLFYGQEMHEPFVTGSIIVLKGHDEQTCLSALNKGRSAGHEMHLLISV